MTTYTWTVQYRGGSRISSQGARAPLDPPLQQQGQCMLSALATKIQKGAVQECFFCPSYFLSPYFSKYTNDDTLKTNFKFIEPPPQIKKTKNKSHFGAVFSQRLFSVAYSIWVRSVASAYLLSEPTIFPGKYLYQVRNVLFFQLFR